jgi:hypothetical protein
MFYRTFTSSHSDVKKEYEFAKDAIIKLSDSVSES